MLARRTALVKLWDHTATRTAGKQGTARGEDIIDLTTGEIWSELAPSVREGAIAAINGNLNRYTDPIGLLELRHALACRLSGETVQPWSADEIAVTSGAKQALFNAAMAILNPGDEVLIPTPYWTTFPAQIVIAGGTPVFVETRHNSYVPRLTDLAAAVTSKNQGDCDQHAKQSDRYGLRPRHPCWHSPTRMERNLWIVFDECYGAFAHPPHTHHPILSVAPQARDRTLIVNSFSKSLALTGWRIGYLAGPKTVISAAKTLQSHTTSNPNVIAQHALLHHLKSGGSAFELELRRHCENARALGLSILSNLKLVSPPAAQGGFFFYLDLSGFQRRPTANGCEFNPDDLADALLMNAGVATVSGTAFGDPCGLRLSYGTDLELLGKGLRSLTATLNEWN
ncbi:aminotransferase class I/II-fold pyridoxal phosphate-dependent enzyme [Bradyrhizobium sp. UFLA05-112]